MMDILKIEEHRYSIVYTTKDGKTEVHKRHEDGAWQTLSGNSWVESKNKSELEEAFASKKK